MPLIFVLVILLCVGSILSSCAGMYDLDVKQQCLENGYSQYSMGKGLKGYCIKRVDGTDVIVPLEDLKGEVK